MRKHGRVDTNHRVLVAALQRCGYLVLSLAPLGAGAPDLLTYRRDRGLRLLEVKTRSGKLTTDQVTFQRLGWPVHIVRDLEEVIR